MNLRVDIPDTLPEVHVDPFQMGQVLQNLITNGVQAMAGGGALHISARPVQSSKFKVQGSDEPVRSPKAVTPAEAEVLEHSVPSNYNIDHGTLNVEPDTDSIEISVTDTGEGISPENMEKLFQPLFTTKTTGIGLGLTVCKNLTEANGGVIEAESKLGEGTCFTVILAAEKAMGNKMH